MQPGNTEFDALSNDPAKAVDYIFVIAGWPTLYSVTHDGYAIPSTDDLSSANGFTAIRRWAMVPSGAAAKCKGRPEEGGMTIGETTVKILDLVEDGVRGISSLVSRQAYLDGNLSGPTAKLNGILTRGETTRVLVDTVAGFPSSGTIWISHEAVKYTGTATDAPGGGPRFTGLTRGYLLSSQVEHPANVKVYGFKPSVYRSKAFLYKGYRDLPLDKWLRATGGFVGAEAKTPGGVTVSLLGTSWEMHADGTRKLGNILADATKGTHLAGGAAAEPHQEQDWQNVIGAFDVPETAPDQPLGDGHIILRFADAWYGVKEQIINDAGTNDFAGMRILVMRVVKGLNGTVFPDEIEQFQPIAVAWTNNDFTATSPSGSKPHELLLQLLVSTGTGANWSGSGTNYDIFRKGIGLGISQDLIDISSFDAVTNTEDYDDDRRVFLVFTEPVDAKKFIEEELCRPFGWYLAVGNDGRIKLVQPRHPQKFYVSRANDAISVRIVSTSTAYTATLDAGVYTAGAMASEVARALNYTILQGGDPANDDFSCTYDDASHRFRLSKATGTFDVQLSPDNGWVALGFSAVLGVSSTTSAERGVWNGTTLTKNDLWDVQQVDAREMQASRVSLRANYDWDKDTYRLQQDYDDDETRDLGDSQDPRAYEVKSKGLLGQGLARSNSFGYWEDSGGCDPTRVGPDQAYMLDAAASWAVTWAAHILDRYRHPPLHFKAKLRWKHNRLEVGDVFKIDYDIEGVFVDRELSKTTLSGRLFEVTSIAPNFRGGHLDVTFLGHRHVSY